MENLLNLTFDEISERFKNLQKGKEINIEVFSFKKIGKSNDLFSFIGNSFSNIEVGDYFKSNQGQSFVILEILNIEEDKTEFPTRFIFTIICGVLDN